jgi:hypothetical protein
MRGKHHIAIDRLYSRFWPFGTDLAYRISSHELKPRDVPPESVSLHDTNRRANCKWFLSSWPVSDLYGSKGVLRRALAISIFGSKYPSGDNREIAVAHYIATRYINN